MGFSHRARSFSDRLVRRWIRSSRSLALLAFSASVLIAGKNEVKRLPSVLFLAVRGRNVNPRKVNEVCSCSARRLLSLQYKELAIELALLRGRQRSGFS